MARAFLTLPGCVCSQSGSALAKTRLVVRHVLARASVWLGVKWDRTRVWLAPPRPSACVGMTY